jgi:hypothetical protein
VLKKIPYETNKEYEQLLKQFQEKKSNIETKEGEKLLELLKKQPSVTMKEVVESCVCFQKISDNADLQKLFFDLLIEPKVAQLNQLVLLQNLSDSYNFRFLVEYERRSLNQELKADCVELQYDMESIETKKHILESSLNILRDKEYSSFGIELNKEEAIKNGYREVVIEALLSMKIDDEFRDIYDFLKSNETLHKLLQRNGLSKNEKKAHIGVAIEQSDLPKYSTLGHAIKYDKTIEKMFPEKEIVHLISKEVSIDHAIKFDDVLSGTHNVSIESLTQIDKKAQSTLVKEGIRQLVDASFNKNERLQFYKESLEQKLSIEEQKEFNHLLNKRTQVHEFEKLYHSLNSSELKEQLSQIGRMTFGIETWKKFESIQTFKQELAKQSPEKSVVFSEMMKKDLSEIESQRIMSAIQSIDSRLTNFQNINQLQPKELADILFKMRILYPNWNEELKQQTKKQLTAHLPENKQNEIAQMVGEKEMIHYTSVISSKNGKELQNIIENNQLASKIDEVKLELEKQKIHYLSPVIMETIYEKLSEKNNGYVTIEDKQKTLKELDDLTKKHDLIESIKKELTNKHIKHTDDEVITWVKKFLTTDKENKQKEYKVILKKIDKFLRKMDNQTAKKEISQFLVELNNEKEQIKTAMEDTFFHIHKHRKTDLSVEEQFRIELYQKEVIQNFIHKDPSLKSVIKTCIKQVPLVSYSKRQLKNGRKMTKPFEEDWWYVKRDQLEKYLNSNIGQKNILVSEVNRKVNDLLKVNSKICSQIVWSLAIDAAGASINLNPKYAAEYGYERIEQQYLGKTKQLVESYQTLKWHREDSLLQKIQPTENQKATKVQEEQKSSTPLNIPSGELLSEHKARNERDRPSFSGVKLESLNKELQKFKDITGKAQEIAKQVPEEKEDTVSSKSLKKPLISAPVVDIQTFKEREMDAQKKALLKRGKSASTIKDKIGCLKEIESRISNYGSLL